MRYSILLFLIMVSCGFFATPVSAAIVKIESDFHMLRVGDVFAVDVVLDTELQVVNAVETSVVFPRELLEYVKSEEGSSVVSVWLEKPIEVSDGSVHFSGVTPGGFMQKEAPLVSLTFKVIKVGQTNISIGDSSVLLNDGFGTPAPVTRQDLHISIVGGEAMVTVHTVDDEIPESFVPEIVQDPDLFDGSNVLIFATADKGSGLDYFEVKEGWFGRYHKAAGPYKIANQALDSKISIKAIDKEGNERTEIFYPQNWRPWYHDGKILGTIFTLCVLVLYLFVKQLRLRLQK